MAHFPVLYSDIMNNKVFYQHPNLMRALGMHETVMEVMVNVLGGGESKVIITMPNMHRKEPLDYYLEQTKSSRYLL